MIQFSPHDKKASQPTIGSAEAARSGRRNGNDSNQFQSNSLSSGSRSKPRNMSAGSQSPTRSLMRALTHGAVKVNDGTVLLINKREILNKSGIQGKIA